MDKVSRTIIVTVIERTASEHIANTRARLRTVARGKYDTRYSVNRPLLTSGVGDRYEAACARPAADIL